MHVITALTGIVAERMDEGKVLTELATLFQLYFHGKSQRAFHDALSKLWVKSGLDFRFFIPQALPWLLDLGRIHGLPSCLRQCLHQRLEACELSAEEDLRVAIKLARLFKYSATNGLHYKFGRTERRNAILFHNVKLGDNIKRCFDCVKMDQQEGKSQPRFTDLMQTPRFRPDEFEKPVHSEKSQEMSPKESQRERAKPKSLFSPSSGSPRAPLPHSVFIQKRATDSDFGIQVTTAQDEQIVAELELVQTLSLSELACYEEQARMYLEDGSRTDDAITAILKTVLVAHQDQRHAGMSEAAEESMKGQNGGNRLVESSVQNSVTSLYEIFSTLLASAMDGGPSTDVSTFLYPLLEHSISKGGVARQ